MVELIRNKHSVGQSAYHLVWRPKYNVEVFRHPWVKELCEHSFKQTAEKYGFVIYEMQVMPDHIHLFLEVPADISLSKTMQLFKGRSAREILQNCTKWRAFFSIDGQRKPHLWSPGKFFRSVGNVKADVIANYIAYSQQKWDFNYTDRHQQKLRT
jgi:putative transposase